MPRWDSFGRSLAFAALAAAGLPVAVTFAGALFGGEGAARLYLIAARGVYAIGPRARIAAAASPRSRARRSRGSILALLPLDLRAHRDRRGGHRRVRARRPAARTRAPLRALAIEVALGAAGLATAAWFARGGLLALCLAIWGYFLVQSGYFLFGARGAGAR